MKYAFCFQVAQNGAHDPTRGFVVSSGQGKKYDTEIEFKLGPWRNTPEEASKDKALYEKDRDAFFEMLERYEKESKES